MSQGRELKTQQDIEQHARATAKAKEENWKEVAVVIEAQKRSGIQHNNVVEENAGHRALAHWRWTAGLQAARRSRGYSRGM